MIRRKKSVVMRFDREGKTNIVDTQNTYFGFINDKNTGFFISHKTCLNTTPLKCFNTERTCRISKLVDDGYSFDKQFKVHMELKEKGRFFSLVIVRIQNKNSEYYIHVYDTQNRKDFYEFETMEG